MTTRAELPVGGLRARRSTANADGVSLESSFHPWLGAFETLRVSQGTPLFVPEHAEALAQACRALSLPADFDFRPAAATLPPEDGRWRWVITPESSRHFFQPERISVSRGIALVPSEVRVGSANWDARYKTLSYLAHWQARVSAPRGAEALLVNERGEIASGAMSNIFWVKGDTIFTPAPACGCREGVTRAWIRRAIGTRGVRAKIRELDRADEIFLTNSLRGIVPVTRWRERRLEPGPATKALQSLYRLACRAQLLLNPPSRPNTPTS